MMSKIQYIERETSSKHLILHWPLYIFTAGQKPKTFTQSTGEKISRKPVVAIWITNFHFLMF